MHAFPSPTILLENYPGTLSPNQSSTTLATNHTSATARTNSSTAPNGVGQDLSADPIATHLLVETALSDATSYDVLSVSASEDLKRELTQLETRIKSTRRKLALETKVRDAAASLGRLYANSRRSSGASSSGSLGRRNSGLTGVKSETAERAETELTESRKKCEELARELYYLEGKERNAKERLLRHTAGVLRATYGDGHRPAVGLQIHEHDDDEEDDEMDGKATIRFKEEHLAIGKKLAEVSALVKDILTQIDEDNPFLSTKGVSDISLGASRMDYEMFEQIQYLDRGLDELKRDPEVAKLLDPQRRGDEYNNLEAGLLRQMLEVNNKLIQVLHATGSSESSQVPSIRDGLNTQFGFAHGVLVEIAIATRNLSEAAQTPEKSPSTKAEKLAQYESVVKSLWQIITTEEDSSKRRRKSIHPDQPSLSDILSSSSSAQPFSLPLFATKLKWILANSTSLSSQTTDLQTRLATLHANPPPNPELVRNLTTQLEQAKQEHATTQAELGGLHSHLKLAQNRAADLEESHADLQNSHDELGSVLDTLRTQNSVLSQKHAVLETTYVDVTKSHAALEKTHNDLNRKFAGLQDDHRDLQDTHSNVLASQQNGARDTQRAAELQTQLDNRITDIQKLKAQVAAITQVRDEAVARASNAQTAQKTAESKHAAVHNELAALKSLPKVDGDVGKLKRELAATLADFEDLTRASVEAEREREERDREVDRLRDEIERLETALSEEKVNKLGMGLSRSVTSDGVPMSAGLSGVSSTSSGVLRTEFKKMVRDMRSDHGKALRVSFICG
jgi:hypothetical protein